MSLVAIVVKLDHLLQMVTDVVYTEYQDVPKITRQMSDKIKRRIEDVLSFYYLRPSGDSSTDDNLVDYMDVLDDELIANLLATHLQEYEVRALKVIDLKGSVVFVLGEKDEYLRKSDTG